jgi:hypothetical protein
MFKKKVVKKGVLAGTIRVNAKSLKAYKKTGLGWVRSSVDVSSLLACVKLFKANNNFDVLVDKKNSKFLKGQVSKDGMTQGARVNIMPDGQVIDKAYSLFAKGLRLHDQDSHDHWDVLFENKGGTVAYCYTLEKKKLHANKKYKKVHKFDKVFDKLNKNVDKALRDKKDHVAVAMHTLLSTKMRVGNEIYFKAHGHKGLTTLLKKDVKIRKNKVEFKYFGKDGVPRDIVQEFSSVFVKRLKEQMKGKKSGDFVFSSCKTARPLAEREFKKAFLKYCGEEFYPHIVRSHFATSRVKNFLKGKRKASKEEVENLFMSIAHELGHRKFSKKENKWVDSHSVTVNHYIQPELVDRVRGIIVGKKK